MDEMITRNYTSLFCEPDEMKDSGLPPRTAEELWELAKERKKNNVGGKKRIWNEATRNDQIADRINPQAPDSLKNYPEPGLLPTSDRNMVMLLHPPKESESQVLPLPVPLQNQREDYG